jgi:hypothetical protein
VSPLAKAEDFIPPSTNPRNPSSAAIVHADAADEACRENAASDVTADSGVEGGKGRQLSETPASSSEDDNTESNATTSDGDKEVVTSATSFLKEESPSENPDFGVESEGVADMVAEKTKSVTLTPQPLFTSSDLPPQSQCEEGKEEVEVEVAPSSGASEVLVREMVLSSDIPAGTLAPLAACQDPPTSLPATEPSSATANDTLLDNNIEVAVTTVKDELPVVEHASSSLPSSAPAPVQAETVTMPLPPPQTEAEGDVRTQAQTQTQGANESPQRESQQRGNLFGFRFGFGGF